MKNRLLLALDLDGTLLNSTLKISPITKKRLKEFQDLGHFVTIATGRPLPGTLDFARELGLKIPLILSNGALVAGIDGKKHSFYPVDVQAGLDLVQYCRQNSIPCNFLVGEEIYMLMPCPLADRLHRKYDKIAPQLTEDPRQTVGRGVTNFVIMQKQEQLPETYAQLQTEFGGRLNIARSGPLIISVFEAGVSKGRALLELAHSLGIESSNTIAVGDNHNDLEMLAVAGLGVAMAGADDIVKGKADYITTGNDEDGIAALVEAILTSGDHLSLAERKGA